MLVLQFLKFYCIEVSYLPSDKTRFTLFFIKKKKRDEINSMDLKTSSVNQLRNAFLECAIPVYTCITGITK